MARLDGAFQGILKSSREQRKLEIKRQKSNSFGGQGNYVIVDHCSASWSVDETLSSNKASNLTVQWCMVTESLHESVHKKDRRLGQWRDNVDV